jgi:hypothetical protein
MAFTPYSVSPRRNDHSRGPKPRKYSVTFMWLHLAVAKWPSSWIMTMTMMATMTMSRSREWVSMEMARMAATTANS